MKSLPRWMETCFRWASVLSASLHNLSVVEFYSEHRNHVMKEWVCCGVHAWMNRIAASNGVHVLRTPTGVQWPNRQLRSHRPGGYSKARTWKFTQMEGGAEGTPWSIRLVTMFPRRCQWLCVMHLVLCSSYDSSYFPHNVPGSFHTYLLTLHCTAFCPSVRG